jgi:hypothetical protein
MPFLPFVLVLVGLAILTHAPWLVFIGLGVLFFARAHRRHHGGTSAWHGGCGSAAQSSGKDRAERGRWA